MELNRAFIGWVVDISSGFFFLYEGEREVEKDGRKYYACQSNTLRGIYQVSVGIAGVIGDGPRSRLQRAYRHLVLVMAWIELPEVSVDIRMHHLNLKLEIDCLHQYLLHLKQFVGDMDALLLDVVAHSRWVRVLVLVLLA